MLPASSLPKTRPWSIPASLPCLSRNIQGRNIQLDLLISSTTAIAYSQVSVVLCTQKLCPSNELFESLDTEMALAKGSTHKEDACEVLDGLPMPPNRGHRPQQLKKLVFGRSAIPCFRYLHFCLLQVNEVIDVCFLQLWISRNSRCLPCDQLSLTLGHRALMLHAQLVLLEPSSMYRYDAAARGAAGKLARSGIIMPSRICQANRQQRRPLLTMMDSLTTGSSSSSPDGIWLDSFVTCQLYCNSQHLGGARPVLGTDFSTVGF